MTEHIKQQLVTSTIRINSRDVYNTKNINGLILYNLKSKIESSCGKHGYVLKDSTKLIKRSYGKTVMTNRNSDIEYDITYTMDVIYPSRGDLYDCTIEDITKMGIIGYFKNSDESNIKNSPIIIIIPKEYIISKDISEFSKGQKIKVEIIDIRIKYRSNQIQSVGKIE